MFITAATPSRSLRSYHDGRDHWLLVGGEGHPTGAGEAQPERYEALDSFAREHFDIIDIPYRWSTQDGMPTDNLPYIGSYTPAAAHLFVAAGFQKWGMTSATIAATVLADLIAGRENPYADVFDPNRATVRSAPAVAKAQLSAARHLVGDRLTPPTPARSTTYRSAKRASCVAAWARSACTATRTTSRTPSRCVAPTSAAS